MIHRSQSIRDEMVVGWQMPIVPENYDRHPLTEEEHEALAHYALLSHFSGHESKVITLRKILARFDQPIADVFHLRHQGKAENQCTDTQRFIRREMHRHQKTYWDWEPEEWRDTICPTPVLFHTKHGNQSRCVRTSVMDAAYLLGEMSDLRSVGIGSLATAAANIYFGVDLLDAQCARLLETLTGRGYKDGRSSVSHIRQALSLLSLLKRTPYLEDITEELLDAVTSDGHVKQQVGKRVGKALHHLTILFPKEPLALPCHFDSHGMAPEWYEWCLAWYDQAVDLSVTTRKQNVSALLATGRWLLVHAPSVRTPEQWTEDLALCFRADLCSWTYGQYGSEDARRRLASRDHLDTLLGPRSIASYLVALRRYLTDLTRRSYVIAGASAHKIKLDFVPKEVLTTPNLIKRAIDAVSPRDINLQVWAKLTIAAATLAESDLPQGAHYPLSFYRAMGLIWVTSARRPNEIARLRLDCLREDWDPEMCDEDDRQIPRVLMPDARSTSPQQQEEKDAKMYYLHIPSGKSRGPFWIWIPDYVAVGIMAWKRERPSQQQPLLDSKDRVHVDYLFCSKNKRVGSGFLNSSLIPVLCAKAGIESRDAKGRITGHRGRSSRLTLLRNRGVSLDDLAEYAGHIDTRTIRRYANTDPILLHRVIRAADDMSRVIEGVIDLQAASKGFPALRWFIGYEADGAPLYCANQVYHTCPHRLDCPKCGMFIGGEKAKLLHEGENTLPVTSKVPMTPVEKCIVNGDDVGTAACQGALQTVPVPEAPDIRLIFHPEGLSNHELEQLALLGTCDALDTLQQALQAHEQRLTEVQQHKTGRSALVGAQKKRVSFIKELMSRGEGSLPQPQEK